jgi:hypothetical protein
MKKSKRPILRCVNYDTFEVIECRCSRKRMRKIAGMYKGRKTKYKNIKIFEVQDYAYDGGSK